MPRGRRTIPVPSKRALPANVTELRAQRVVDHKPSMVDECEKALDMLFDDPDFRKLRGEDDPESYVEGSVWADDTVAAQMVRDKGREMQLPLIMAADLTDIANKLRAAERRFNASRKQRKAASA